jgi:hypothetical protein
LYGKTERENRERKYIQRIKEKIKKEEKERIQNERITERTGNKKL